MSHKNTFSALIKKLLSSSLFGIFVLFFFSATAVFATQPSVSGLTIIYKNYVSSTTSEKVLLKTIEIPALVAAYKSYVPAKPATPTQTVPTKTSVTVSSLSTAYKNYISPKP